MKNWILLKFFHFTLWGCNSKGVWRLYCILLSQLTILWSCLPLISNYPGDIHDVNEEIINIIVLFIHCCRNSCYHCRSTYGHFLNNYLHVISCIFHMMCIIRNNCSYYLEFMIINSVMLYSYSTIPFVLYGVHQAGIEMHILCVFGLLCSFIFLHLFISFIKLG
jgi:hypothetical protein